MSEAWRGWLALSFDQIVSSSAHRPALRQWRGCWRRLRADAKKSFKKAELARRRRRHHHGAHDPFLDLSGRVGIRFHVGIGGSVCHFCVGRSIEIFFIAGRELRTGILEVDGGNRLEWI